MNKLSLKCRWSHVASIAMFGAALLEVSVPGSAAPSALHVSGNHLLNSTGQNVVLKGIDVPSLDYSNEGQGVMPDDSGGTAPAVPYLLGSPWSVGVIRLPICQDRWMGYAPTDWSGPDNASTYQHEVDEVVNAASAVGAYVVVDMHWSDEGVWGQNLGQHEMPDENTATAWSSVAAHYANNPAVLFDAYNEPHDVNWGTWLSGGWVSEGPGYESPGMQGIVNTIRATGANNVILVGGLQWAYDLTGVMNGYAISGSNIMYSAHVYPWKSNWDQYVTVAAGSYPIFVGEFGADSDSNGNNPGGWMNDLTGWMDAHGYSGAAWSSFPDNGASATYASGNGPFVFNDWTFSLTSWDGAYVLPWVQEGSGRSSGGGSTTGGGGGGSVDAPYGGTPAAVPGTVQAENYDTGGQGVAYNVTSTNGTANSCRSDGVDLETTTDTGGGYDLGWSAAGQWFNYTVNVSTTGTYKVSFRIANGLTAAGSFHLASSSGANLTGSVSVPVTGGWQDWTTVTATVTLPSGKQVLTFDQDTAGYNLNYMTFALSTSSSQPLSNGVYTLTPACATGSRLDVAAAGTTNGTNVDIWQSNGTNAQNWSLTNVSGSTYTLSPLSSPGLVLDVSGAGSANDTNVDIWASNGTNAQLWTLAIVSGGYTLAPACATGSHLDVAAAGSTNGTNVDIYQANGTNAQTWSINAE